ncbi:MAG TPA: hypothetical protein VJ806_01770 [Luteimonas sp.]|nr:hypothetical protein [Luteimonas sp.]
MSEQPSRTDVAPPPQGGAHRRWDALGIIVASAIGLLALLVSGYTAYIQRQQVRAQVWPYLTVAYQDQELRLTLFNKGVGPGMVRSVRVTVDGKPQRDWRSALTSLGLPSNDYRHSTLSETVLSPGESLAVIVLPDAAAYTRFRAAMDTRGAVDFCYCSTLGDCWMFEDRRSPIKPVVRAVTQCPRLPASDAFTD